MATTQHHGDFRGRSEAVLAVTITMMSLGSVFVFFRMLSRAAIVKKVSWDDYFMVLAWSLLVGLGSAICYGTAYGLGRHEVDVPHSWQSGLRKAIYAFSILYQPALMATKTSILAFYLTLSKANRTFRWACYVTFFIVNAGGLSLTLVTVFQCVPVSAVFKSPIPASAKCTDILTIYLSSIPLNIITDLTLLFLPMPILTGMRLPRKQKIIVLVTFSFGIFVVVVDVVRISYLQSASMTRLQEIATAAADENDMAEQTDASYFLAFSLMWSAIEVSVGIMCGCVPGLKPLVARFMPHLLRDPGDPPSQFGSFSLPNPEVTAIAPPVPDEVHHEDLGRGPHDEDQNPMGMMEFLTGRRDFAHAPINTSFEEPAGIDFLTTPERTDLSRLPPMERSQTALTNSTRHTKPESPTFFDFVDLRQKKSLVYMTNRESIYPIAMVTVLFFIWGFEYGLLDTLNRQFQTVASVTQGQALGIRSAYYVGYFFGPFTTGRLVLKHWGFRACYPIGLSIYAAGCLIFWPAAVLTSWPTFIVTNFIVGFGLSNLEVSANPFIVLCGPAEYAEVRLNLSQGVQAIGSIVAPLIANKAFFHKTMIAPNLVSTQWAYLGIALATVVLALVYYYLPLPEATDDELEDAAERMDGANKAKLGSINVTWIVLAMGVLGLFCYVGGQEVVSSSFGAYLDAIAPTYNHTNFLAIAHTAFAVSRFLAAGLGLWIRPRILLLFFSLGTILFTALCTHFTGATGVAVMILVFFFEGPLFSLIFAQALRGQGRNTKFASVLITTSISGGAVFSPIATTVLVADNGQGAPYSLVVAIAAFAGCTVFPIALNTWRGFRLVVEPLGDVTDSGGHGGSRPSSTSSAASRALSFLNVKFTGKKDRRRQESGEEVEWREKTLSPGPGLGEHRDSAVAVPPPASGAAGLT
ncbi:L-fucose-proton symporter [Lecanosticta acicola]|uniref:L-fucose-proton symporter n=1 Tax=Lecanosticta acicola TaxID=111012 RepID=A0AAI8Z6J0_9PEZI|nr:L-fucose-proton symporter [Lecanosticta acicola]